MSHTAAFFREDQLEIAYHQEIARFWQTGDFNHFTSQDGKQIQYAGFKQANADKCILIVPGRAEGYLKYKELAYNFSQFGYRTVIIDHRGQGLSDRLTANRQQGFVNQFDDYVDDLKQLIDQVLPSYCNGKRYLLAHSMGGAIAATTLQKYGNNAFSAMVLSSPMLGINSGGLPQWLARAAVNSGQWLNQTFSETPWYFFGQSDYQVKQFQDNPLTHSAIRYQLFVAEYQATPDLQLGGVTFKWLQEALSATDKLLTEPVKFTVPTHILQATADNVVDNAAQQQYCQKLLAANVLSCPNGEPIFIRGAKHEILFERDDLRSQAIDYILSVFSEPATFEATTDKGS